MTVQAKVDTSSAFAGLDKLSLALKTKVARSMGVAAGQVFRDEAKRRAPIGDHGPDEGISPYPGAIREAIYLAFREGRSTKDQVFYSVSWNKRIAPHAHWIEFGHWRVNVLVPTGAAGMWVATKERLPSPKWVPADPFMRPALESMRHIAAQVAIDRGKVRLAELLAGKDSGTES